MGIVSTIRAFFEAATALMRVLPLVIKTKLEHELDEIEDEIWLLGRVGDAVSKLRLDALGKRKRRIIERIRAL